MKYRDHERELKRIYSQHNATIQAMRTKHEQEKLALEKRIAWLESKLRLRELEQSVIGD